MKNNRESKLYFELHLGGGFSAPPTTFLSGGGAPAIFFNGAKRHYINQESAVELAKYFPSDNSSNRAVKVQ